MAKTARLELRVAPELLAQVDEARGDVSRTRWVERALEYALSYAAVGKAGMPDGDKYLAGAALAAHQVKPPASPSQGHATETELRGLANIAEAVLPPVPTVRRASSQGHAITIKPEVFEQPPGPLKFTAEEEAAHVEAQRHEVARQLVQKERLSEAESVLAQANWAMERQARLNKAREKK